MNKGALLGVYLLSKLGGAPSTLCELQAPNGGAVCSLYSPMSTSGVVAWLLPLSCPALMLLPIPVWCNPGYVCIPHQA